jgi:hypothetical protein
MAHLESTSLDENTVRVRSDLDHEFQVDLAYINILISSLYSTCPRSICLNGF